MNFHTHVFFGIYLQSMWKCEFCHVMWKYEQALTKIIMNKKKIEKNKNGVWNKTMTTEWLSVYTQHHFHSTYHLYYFYSLLRCHVTLSAKTSKSFIYDKLLRFMFPTLRSRGVLIWNSTVSKRKRTLFVWVFPGVLFWIIRVWIFF